MISLEDALRLLVQKVTGKPVDEIPSDLEGIVAFAAQNYEPSAEGESGGMPPGGLAGQVLTKKTDDDYDTKWTTIDGSISGGSNDLTKNNCRVITNVAQYFLNTGTNGAIKISLPNKLTGDTMMSGEIIGYDHSTRLPWRVDFAAMGAQDSWVYLNGVLYPGCPFTTIRTGYDKSYICIILGTTSTTWSYPSITIPRVQLSYKGVAAAPTEWEIEMITSESGITFSGSNSIKTISYT